MTASSMRISLVNHQPYDYQYTLDNLQRSPFELTHRVVGTEIIKWISNENLNAVIRIRGMNPKALIVDSLTTQLTDLDKAWLKTYVMEWLGLTSRLEAFYDFAKRDLLLKPLTKQFRGLRIVGVPNLFEALAWSIIGQQINLNFAYRVRQTFVMNYGRRLTHDNQEYYMFPSPQTVFSISSAKWKEMQFSKQKARYMCEAATFCLDEKKSKQSLSELSPLELEKSLLGIIGIGQWSANYVMMRCFHVTTAFPSGDAGLHQAIRNQLDLGRKPTAAELEKLALQWKPWQAYATYYLWQSLR